MNIWEKTFRDREWGKYPPEELIRAVCGYTKDDKTKSVLEIGWSELTPYSLMRTLNHIQL